MDIGSQNRSCARRDWLGNSLCVQAKVTLYDVYEDRHGAIDRNHHGGGRRRLRVHDDFLARTDSRRAGRHDQPRGCRVA